MIEKQLYRLTEFLGPNMTLLLLGLIIVAIALYFR